MHSVRAHLAPLALFCFLTLLLAFPIVAGLGTAVPGWEGDNLYYVRSMWWMKHALFDLRMSPFVDPLSFYPIGEHIARSEMTPANTVLALPLTLVTSPETSYSVMVLFSFVATAMGTYMWVVHLTGRPVAGIIAGTIAAFLPMRFAHLPGHLPQITTEWVPWTLFAFERFLERRTIARGLALGVLSSLVVLGCWYYGYALFLMLPLYAVLRTWHDRGVWREMAWWRGLAVAAAVGAMLVLPFLLQMLQLTRTGEITRSIVEMDSWSLNPYDFFVPSPWHAVWGSAATRWFPHQAVLWVERGVGFGYVAFALALIGFFGAKSRVFVALAGVWIMSFLIALGPTLHFKDEQVRVPMPESVVKLAVGLIPTGSERMDGVRRKIEAGGALPIPLPSFLLYYAVPMTSSMRIMGRFALWTGLMTAALAGFGIARLTAGGERRWGRAARYAIPGAAIALIAFESLTPIPMTAVSSREVDRWLASQPPDTVVVELPVAQAVRPVQNYFVTIHQRRMVFGWNGDSFAPPEHVEREERLKDFPSPASLAFLRAIGVTYVLMTPSKIPEWASLSARLDVPELTLDRVVGEVRVYRVQRDTVSKQ